MEKMNNLKEILSYKKLLKDKLADIESLEKEIIDSNTELQNLDINIELDQTLYIDNVAVKVKQYPTTKFDSTSLKKEVPDIYQKYTKTSIQRRITYKYE